MAASRPLSPFDRQDGANLRERKKAESQLRILEAAKTIFFRDGFKDANLDEVARRAAVAK